jgi:hypothetical protein
MERRDLPERTGAVRLPMNGESSAVCREVHAMHQSPSIHDFVADALRAMGIPVACSLPSALALREGRLVAEKFLYAGGYAVWQAGRNVVEFFDQEGKRLQTLPVDVARTKTTATSRRRSGKAA